MAHSAGALFELNGCGLFLGNFCSPRLLATMQRNQSEWIWLFGASMRSERATYFNDPMPKASGFPGRRAQIQIGAAPTRCHGRSLVCKIL